MFLNQSDEVGITVLTSSGVVNDSGKPQRLYGYCFKSGGTAGVLTLFNGTSSVSPATLGWDHTGLISSTVIQPLASGIVFSKGLYASFDGNVSSATFWVSQKIT